jgi:hypothetical protein
MQKAEFQAIAARIGTSGPEHAFSASFPVFS